MDRLEEIIVMQTKFMDQLGLPRVPSGGDITNISGDRAIQKTHIPQLMYALTCELGEIGDALNWKPWKKTEHPIDVENLRMEFIDALHFLFEMMIMCGMNAETIHAEYKKKMEENIARQARGY